MTERRTIGQILLSFGRITEENVEQVVAYQQENGGYFGEALVALDLVSQEELEWGLASQYDLPYVFPDADTIDPEAAALVTPEWALAHMTLPIMKTADSLTVIVDSPMRTDAVDELQLRTDLEIELALASSGKIRDLIRQVYARAQATEGDAESLVPISLREAIGSAMDHGARRFGISTRGPRARFWYKEGGRVRRRLLDGRWQAELDEVVTPPPGNRIEEGAIRAEWSGHLNQNGIVNEIEVHFLASEQGSEYLCRLSKTASDAQRRFPRPGDGFLSEVRLLARSGSGRFLVVSEPVELLKEILPHLPALLLDPSWRGLHVTDACSEETHEVFSVCLSEDRAEHPGRLLELHPFAFDAITADISGPLEEWVAPVLNLAPNTFVPWREEDDPAAAREAGIRWELRIERNEGDALEWHLHPLAG